MPGEDEGRDGRPTPKRPAGPPTVVSYAVALAVALGVTGVVAASLLVPDQADAVVEPVSVALGAPEPSPTSPPPIALPAAAAVPAPAAAPTRPPRPVRSTAPSPRPAFVAPTPGPAAAAAGRRSALAKIAAPAPRRNLLARRTEPARSGLPPRGAPGTPTTTDRADDRAQVAIRFAMAQLGLPYVWGGNGPANGHRGFDCSGLTHYAYAAAGIKLPRTAHTQYYAGPRVPASAPLMPGDLVFYGVPSRVHHVGLYLGGGKMVNAPTFGKPVRVASVRYRGDDYLGATRPAARPGPTGPVWSVPVPPEVSAPAATPQPPEPDFPAPEVPAPAPEDITAEPDPVPPAPVDPVTGEPVPVEPATGDPATGDPATGDPATGGPATGDPAPNGPVEPGSGGGPTPVGSPGEPSPSEPGTEVPGAASPEPVQPGPVAPPPDPPTSPPPLPGTDSVPPAATAPPGSGRTA